MDERRFVVWDADGRPLDAFPDFDTAHQRAHVRMRQARTSLPLTLDDRVAKVSRVHLSGAGYAGRLMWEGNRAMDGSGTLYALIEYGGEERWAVSGVVMAFESVTAADQHARSAGMSDYAVGPVRFTESVAAPAVRWHRDSR
ncbi:hypothetical protein [Protofrankia symbiont of Coriaria ruscifolia]|uniref:Uncharacterized protein n=1 Tax=Candidatus Protofrankia californiensis TaxID=1839754 RepID=A0A1C3NVY2_9ACTN|nr:hypothetical protein [Protofrankia symbiont of Coriaria ruscifolia]SBW20005.1 hypothetical protein FDG2_1559 [Candidatus Protofrankia californiensis]